MAMRTRTAPRWRRSGGPPRRWPCHRVRHVPGVERSRLGHRRGDGRATVPRRCVQGGRPGLAELVASTTEGTRSASGSRLRATGRSWWRRTGTTTLSARTASSDERAGRSKRAAVVSRSIRTAPGSCARVPGRRLAVVPPRVGSSSPEWSPGACGERCWWRRGGRLAPKTLPQTARMASAACRVPSAGSGGSRADTDAVEAVDLDELLGSDEVEVLAPARLPALCASDVEHFDVATVDGDVVAGSDVAGEGDLGLPSARWTSSHADSLLWMASRTPAVGPPACWRERPVRLRGGRGPGPRRARSRGPRPRHRSDRP